MEVRDQFHNRPDLVAQDGKTTLKDCIIMASNGEPIPPHMDVIPDSNKCVAISTKSSVREMIAPGAYAILAPLFVGFLVGPRCLVGMLAGGIGSGAMVAIMMSNAGGAWDNAKKYCEKDGTKVTICVEINQCVGCTRQFTKSCLGDDAAVLTRSSGKERPPPRHRAGVASMANAP